MKRIHCYHTPEQVQWVRDNCQGLSYAALTSAFNLHWSTKLTEMQIKGICWNNGIKTGAYRRQPLPVGAVSGRKIKTGDNEWRSVQEFLHLKELKKALRARLKEIDKKLYNKRFEYGNKKYKINDSQLIKNLTGGGNG